MPKSIILYSTLGCHLCELAREEIEPCLTQTNFILSEVDIADNPELLKAYGTSIPVLFDPNAKRELFWPFDQLDVRQFLSGCINYSSVRP